MSKVWKPFRRRVVQSPTASMSQGRNEHRTKTTNELCQSRVYAWNSIWLSRPTLGVIATVFTVLAMALLLLWRLNERDGGFTLITSNHYSWTYGPTGILVIVVAFWRQVDFQCKAASPWIMLYKGGVSAEMSILLDLISPFQLVSLWKAIRSGSLLVIVTISGFLVLKLITLASTGLLVEQPTTLPGSIATLAGVSTFNGSLYNETEYVTKTDASLVYTAYGIMAKGLPTGYGTTGILAYETFNLPSGVGELSAQVNAQVRAILPDFKCQPAEVSINPTPYGPGGTQTGPTMSINSPACQIMDGAEPVLVLNADVDLCPLRQLRGAMVPVNCSVDALVDPVPNRQLLVLTEVIYNQTLNSSTGSTSTASVGVVDVLSWSVGIGQTISLLCEPSYRLTNINVTYGYSPGSPLITTSVPEVLNDTLDNFLDGDLALMFTAALTDAAEMFGDSSQSQTADEFPNTMFKLMAAVSGGAYEDLLDQETMSQAAQTTFQHIAVQIVSKNLLAATNGTIRGDLALTGNRLKIDPVALWIMIGGFVVMTVLCILGLCLRPSDLMPHCMGNISGLVQTLARSHRLHDLLCGVRGLSEKDISLCLDGYLFSSQHTSNVDDPTGCIVRAFKPQEAASDFIHDASVIGRKSDNPWWKPLFVRRSIIIITLILPVAAIAVLEVLQQWSDQNQGILSTSDAGGTKSTLLIRLLPALVMMIIAASFNSLDFNISVLAPFNSMIFRAVPAERSVDSSLVDKLPFLALWNAAKHRQIAAFCSSVAAITGSVLTIVVSGLYTVENVSSSREALVKNIDAFNTTWPGSATNDSSAAVLTSLTESLNLTYPEFTFGELALLVLASPVDANTTTSPQLEIQYPALRASLSCSQLEFASFNVSAAYMPQLESSSATINARLPLPSECQMGGPGGNMSYIDLQHSIGFQENTSYIGKLLDIHVGPYDPVQGSASGEAEPSAMKDNPPGCPSLAMIYGYVDVNNQNKTSVTTLMCYQQMQQVQTTVLFDLPAMSISTVKPRVPDESTVEFLPSSAGGDTTFSYRIQQHMDQSFSLFNQTEFPSANLADSPVDNFFQGVLFGQTPLPLATLAAQDQGSVMMQGINAFYRRYMAQAISNNMRVATSSTPPSTGSTSYKGTILNAAQTPRLVQHRSAKWALQILLASMTVLGVLAWRLTRLTDLVPYNPCTIFGVAALLAGSRMCRDDTFAQQTQNQQLKYKLGWWDGDVKIDGEDAAPERASVGTEEGEPKRSRYGIDIVESDD